MLNDIHVCDVTCQNQAFLDKTISLQIQIEEMHSFKMTPIRTVYLNPGPRYYTFGVYICGITVL